MVPVNVFLLRSIVTRDVMVLIALGIEPVNKLLPTDNVCNFIIESIVADKEPPILLLSKNRCSKIVMYPI